MSRRIAGAWLTGRAGQLRGVSPDLGCAVASAKSGSVVSWSASSPRQCASTTSASSVPAACDRWVLPRWKGCSATRRRPSHRQPRNCPERASPAGDSGACAGGVPRATRSTARTLTSLTSRSKHAGHPAACRARGEDRAAQMRASPRGAAKARRSRAETSPRPGDPGASARIETVVQRRVAWSR